MDKISKKKLYIEIVKAIEGTVTIKEFEQWLYAQTQLQEEMGESDFIWEIFALNYSQKSRFVVDELASVLRGELSWSEIELVMVKELLFDAYMNSTLDKMVKVCSLYYSDYPFYEVKCLKEFESLDKKLELFEAKCLQIKFEDLMKDFKIFTSDFLLQLYQAESEFENFTLKDFIYKEQK